MEPLAHGEPNNQVTNEFISWYICIMLVFKILILLFIVEPTCPEDGKFQMQSHTWTWTSSQLMHCWRSGQCISSSSLLRLQDQRRPAWLLCSGISAWPRLWQILLCWILVWCHMKVWQQLGERRWTIFFWLVHLTQQQFLNLATWP